ncbi:hypothetical protein [Streptomyces sp. NPDC002602]|uniref:hypothetical protein n=1 Tax=Streptomyces sp. NPDC002602 TaxID=3364654 RepID=UPI0036A2D713
MQFQKLRFRSFGCRECLFPASLYLPWAQKNDADLQLKPVHEDRRRAAQKAEREREQLDREERRLRREAAAWPCPECGRKVYPPGPDDNAGSAPGGLCSVCRSVADREAREARERAEEQVMRQVGSCGSGPRGRVSRSVGTCG